MSLMKTEAFSHQLLCLDSVLHPLTLTSFFLASAVFRLCVFFFLLKCFILLLFFGVL